MLFTNIQHCYEAKWIHSNFDPILSVLLLPDSNFTLCFKLPPILEPSNVQLLSTLWIFVVLESRHKRDRKKWFKKSPPDHSKKNKVNKWNFLTEFNISVARRALRQYYYIYYKNHWECPLRNSWFYRLFFYMSEVLNSPPWAQYEKMS